MKNEEYIIRRFDINSAEDFTMWKQLNLQWLKGYAHSAGKIPYLLEKNDFITLDNPVENIIHKGGEIWFAEVLISNDKKIVGTIGLTPCDNEWELNKLAVVPEFQGKGIGKILVQTALDFAKKLGIKKLVLDSNSHLIKAIRLYESFGFKHIQPRGHYETADVAMEKII